LKKLQLRPARLSDVELYFEWANDPLVRASAFNQNPVFWEGHCEWFAKRMANPASYLFVAENELGQPIGQIRFDESDGVATISYSLAAAARGQGLGAPLLEAGIQAYSHAAKLPLPIQGWVKTENMASCKAFLKAGFVDVGLFDMQGAECHLFKQP